jgi:hypothetical protein
MVMLKFPVIAEANPDERGRMSMMADEDEPMAIDDGEFMATDEGESMATGEGESMATGEDESMAIGEGESIATGEASRWQPMKDPTSPRIQIPSSPRSAPIDEVLTRQFP